jgi:hypothetical protein
LVFLVVLRVSVSVRVRIDIRIRSSAIHIDRIPHPSYPRRTGQHFLSVIHHRFHLERGMTDLLHANDHDETRLIGEQDAVV